MSFTSNWSQKVVSMSSRPEPVMAELCAEFERAWLQMRPQGDVMPTRAHFLPERIAADLSACFMAELIAPGQLRLRFAGRALCDLLDMELRGMPFSALIAPEGRADFAQAVAAFSQVPQGVEVALSLGGRLILRPRRLRLVMLPMRGHDGRPTRVLGCLAGLDAAGSGGTPRRLNFTGYQLFDLAQVGHPRSPAYEPVVAPEPRSGFAEARARFEPTKAPHLRVVKT